MKCAVCLNEAYNITEIYNDCVLNSLEKIKTHYMGIKKQLLDYESVMRTLQDKNSKLESAVVHYKQIEKNIDERRMTCSDNHDHELQCISIMEKVLLDKSEDNFNTAMNNENEFEISLINNSPVRIEEKQIIIKKEPMKNVTIPINNDYVNNIPKKSSVDNLKRTEINDKLPENKKACWISKGNENQRTHMGPYHRHPNRSLRYGKLEKPSNLSLKSERLRQTRLKLEISKNVSHSRDSTFCDEVIEATPKPDSTLRKINSSRQWVLSNKSNKIDKPDNEIIFEEFNRSPRKLTFSNEMNKDLETSSVVMLTPVTQDIIFLDDSCETSNIESMDLLRDMMNPSESNINNLKRIESDRIKLLHKIVDTVNNKIPDFEKLSMDSTKSSNETKENINMDMEHLKNTDKMSGRKRCILKPSNESPSSDVKDEYNESERRNRLFNVDCSECQMYIKYLGARLSDAEIEQYIRKCTKHKKRIEVNPTPDGFWDPVIKSFDSNDPRNETLIDTRFVGKIKRN